MPKYTSRKPKGAHPLSRQRRSSADVMQDRLRLKALEALDAQLPALQLHYNEAMENGDFTKVLWVYLQIQGIYTLHGQKSPLSNALDAVISQTLSGAAAVTEDDIPDEFEALMDGLDYDELEN